MNTILIVDDDYIARSKIHALLDWERNGYQITGEVSNGKEALERMEKEMPQIVLVDMDMPVMNGVELIQEIKARGYQTSIIVLSSYNDFDYVRKSMKLGALDYILKSELDAGQMMLSLKRAGDIQDKEKEGLTGKDKEYIRDLYVRKILLGSFAGEDEGRKWIEKYGLGLDFVRNMPALIEIDDYWIAVEELDEKGVFTFQQFIENLLKEAMQKVDEMTVVKMRENQFCLILSCKDLYSIGAAQQRLNAVVLDVRRNLKRFLNLSVSVGMGTICLSLGELAQCYKRDEERLKQKFYLGKGQMIYDRRAERPMADGIYEMAKQAIGYLFFTVDEEGLEGKIRHIFKMIADSRMAEKKARNLITRILSAVDMETKRQKLDLEVVCGTAEPFEKLAHYETLGDMEDWIVEICRRFLRYAKTEDENYSRLTVHAIAYLSDHYRDNISLSDTARYLEVSSSHLSRVFKNDTGMNLVNYLNRIRIEKARRMMEEDESVQMKNIAVRTGFNSYNHFSATFKGVVGMSPQEYQERLAAGGKNRNGT